jgi:REP element-mobilizing transposase RayT
MPYTSIWIHVVWTTKNRVPYLKRKIRYEVFNHIKDYAGKKGIRIDYINGYVDHVHGLLSLGADQNIADAMNLIKGESSNWINKQNLTEEKFAWQNDYYAASISNSHVERVRAYISGQEIHHSSQTLDGEVEELFPSEEEVRLKPASLGLKPVSSVTPSFRAGYNERE